MTAFFYIYQYDKLMRKKYCSMETYEYGYQFVVKWFLSNLYLPHNVLVGIDFIIQDGNGQNFQWMFFTILLNKKVS